MVLRGRRTECETLDRFLHAVRGGASRALVVRGEPGVGKTALLEYAVDRASGCRVERAAGVESEMELAFAGLHQLCAPMLDHLEQLPGPQRVALCTAFGLRVGEAPDRFLVGLAVLSLLSAAAADRPLLCVVDDAQWLDRVSAQALAFVARRLQAESVGLLFASRESGDEPAGLPDLVVRGLDDSDACALLTSAIAGPLDVRVRDRIVAETRGNPLALLELPQGLSPAELAGGFGRPDALALSSRIEESFRRRLEALGPDTREWLLVAAADPVGDPALVQRAAQRLGVRVDAAAPAAAGLVERGGVRFRHPLVRSAVYGAASASERRRAHGALAEATDPEADPDRRAWHRANATSGLDEEVAAELVRCAGRAQARGGLAAAAAFLERAAALTVDPARRAERALAAAQAKHEAGAQDAARELLATAQTGPMDKLRQARTKLLHAQIAFASRRGSDAPPLLLQAAKRLEPLDLTLARETYLEALSAAVFVGRLADPMSLLEVARAARAAPQPAHPSRPADLLLDANALLITEGYAAAAPLLKRALRAFRSEELSRDERLHWLWLACRTAMDLWDYESWYVLSGRVLQLARDAGALSALPGALTLHAGSRVYAGEFAAAEALIEEEHGLSVAIGCPDVVYSRLILAGWSARQADTAQLIEAGAREAAARGEGRALGAGDYATAVLYNALGRYGDALAASRHAAEHPEDLAFSALVLVELIEAAARSRQPERAAVALERLAVTTRASGTELALGIEARSRALLSAGAEAEDLHREAIDRLGRTRVATYRARAHLQYGEWLRRERRRVDAREQLRTAYEMFAAMGAEGFAARAARELLATGETARRRSAETSGQLTAQEAQIAALARDGLSSPEIAARLFISPRTVEYHLHKIFAKLGITSRRQLAGVLGGEPGRAQPV